MRNEPTSRLNWPREGVAVRVPPRRLAAAAGATCEVIPFVGTQAQAVRKQAWDTVGDALPRGARVVLLVAAEDVSFTDADVPALSGMRLREALPNLVEEKTVGEVGSLHVALGQSAGEGRGRTLAVVDRVWLATIQVHLARSGHRVAVIIPESLAVPFAADAWSLACVAGSDGLRAWLRTGVQQSMLLSDDATSAVAIASALARQSNKPTRLSLYASPNIVGAATALGHAIASSLAVPLVDSVGDPFAMWLAGRGFEGDYGAPLSLLAFDGTRSGNWTRWRIAAALLVAIAAVQILGMQWQWAGLRHESSDLRQQSSTLLTSTFPDTRVVLDAPLQMSRGLAGLRASAGHSDPSDFSMMMAASGRIFAALPSNTLRGADYEARALRLRFAPGNAVAPDDRDRLTAQAAQEGYVLRFEGAPNAAGEALASLKSKGGA
jgi:general secretion pathway protein L